MKTYTSGTGRVTERIAVELTPAEAEAFAEAWEHLEPMLGDVDDWPIATGLRRIATEWRMESAAPASSVRGDHENAPATLSRPGAEPRGVSS